MINKKTMYKYLSNKIRKNQKSGSKDRRGIHENMPREFTIQARYFITFDRVPTGLKFMWLA